jgi:nicotinamide riboside kinase
MKVYFSGSHCVGKSTLCRYVSAKYNLPMIPEIARMVLSEMELQVDSLRSDIDLVNTYQTKVFHLQMEEEQKQQRDFVSDRSAIDCLAYSTQHSTLLPTLIQNKDLQDYIISLRDKKSFIFFVRPCRITLKNDGVRENVTWDGVIAIDAMIKLLLELYSIRYFQIDTESMQERIRFVDSILTIAEPDKLTTTPAVIESDCPMSSITASRISP